MKRTSADFSRLITTQSITVTFDGESHTIKKDNADSVYQLLLGAIREERWDDIPDLLKPEKVVNQLSNGEMRVENGQVYVNAPDEEIAVPSGLNETILFYIEQKLPFSSLIKFAINLNENPSYHSVQQLFNFLNHNQFTITDDGKFIAYKSVKEDFKDVYTGTFDNSVGKVVKMPRNKVNENPEEVCSNGLHVANFHYANDIYSGPQMIFVEVNPKNVVSVPIDYDNAKIRVCEYKVLGTCEKEYKEPLYSAEKGFYNPNNGGEDGETLDSVYDEENDDYDDEQYDNDEIRSYY